MTSGARSDHKRRNSVERREAFLDAAVSAIRRDGPNVSMEVIAREAGVTKPIVYRLFGDRNGLVEALGERLARDVNQQIIKAIADAPKDRKEALRATIGSYIDLISSENDVYRFLTSDKHSPQGPLLTGLAVEIAHTVATVLGEELRELDADSGAAEPWAFGLVGMVHYAGDWLLNNPTMSNEQLVTYLVELIWNGFDSIIATALDRQAALRG